MSVSMAAANSRASARVAIVLRFCCPSSRQRTVYVILPLRTRLSTLATVALLRPASFAKRRDRRTRLLLVATAGPASSGRTTSPRR